MPDTSLSSHDERSDQRQRIRGRRRAVTGPQKRQAEMQLARRLWQLSEVSGDSGKVVGLDRVAVMAALNIANELLQRTDDDRELKDIVGLRVKAMRERLDSALGTSQQLNL